MWSNIFKNNQIFLSIFCKGLVEFASIFGDDVGKEMSKLIVVASGRLVSGSISIGETISRNFFLKIKIS